jgi:hypothetical protein
MCATETTRRSWMGVITRQHVFDDNIGWIRVVLADCMGIRCKASQMILAFMLGH